MSRGPRQPHHPSSAYVFHLLFLRAWVKNQFDVDPSRRASGIMLPVPHAEDGRVAIGAALGATDIAEGAFVCSSSSAGASTGSPSARKNFITSSSPCCKDSLSSPLKGSVTCVSRVLDEGKQAHLPRRISGAVGLRANHGKRPFARKSHSWILVIGFRRTSPVDMAPAMKASGAKRPSCSRASR